MGLTAWLVGPLVGVGVHALLSWGEACRAAGRLARRDVLPAPASADGRRRGGWLLRWGWGAGERLDAGVVSAIAEIALALRAGEELTGALDRAGRAGGSPFRQLLCAIAWSRRRGLPLPSACTPLLGHPDRIARALGQALCIGAETGGDLPRLLDGIADLARRRMFLQAQWEARSAESRLTARLLLGMPPCLALYLALFSPADLGLLWETGPGRWGLAYALVSWTAGACVTRLLLRSGSGG